VNADEHLALAYVGNHPENAARLLEQTDPREAADLLERIPPAMAAAVCSSLGLSSASACAVHLSDHRLTAIAELLPLTTAAALLRRVDPDRRTAVLASLGEAKRERLQALLTYPENTAGALADPEVVALSADIPSEVARRQLEDVPGHLLNYVYVVNRERVLVGTLNIQELMAARPTVALELVMQRDPVRLDAHADVTTVAVHPAWRDFDALPVVDGAGRLVGAIRHRMIRRMSEDTRSSMVGALIGLSEVYWAGLSGIVATLAQAQAQEDPDGA
jgi:magnesium transporter